MSLVPEEIYKRRRRHNNTPSSVLLFFANFIVVSIATSIATSCNSIHWFFWVMIAGLALYNYYDIKRNREEYTKITTIVYVVTTLIIGGVTWYWIAVQNCQ